MGHLYHISSPQVSEIIWKLGVERLSVPKAVDDAVKQYLLDMTRPLYT